MSSDFTRLKQKVFWQVILIAAAACAAGLFIRYILIDGLFQSPFAEGFISLVQSFTNMDYYEARDVYIRYFRDQKAVILSSGFFVLMLFIFYYALSRFTRYFNEISRATDRLLEESDDRIDLSPEMDFMENKLNTVKNTLKKRARDAQEAEQRKNDLVVYLAHDIKTPLTSVIGYLSLLDEAPDMPVEQKAKYVKITLDKAYRLEQLIDEFFEITRFNLQTIVLDKEDINLPFMLMQMADEFYPMLAAQGKTAAVRAEGDLTVYGDADKLARVFNNIFKNAIAYSDDNTAIEITIEKQGEHTVVRFANQGRRIPDGQLQAIFEKFYRLDSARSSRTGGSGLGLAIAREIMNAHGGSISAQSDDQATVFSVELPCRQA